MLSNNNGVTHANDHSTGRPPRTRREFARLITAAWNKQVRTIVMAGRLLREAKEGPNKLPHGEFTRMVNHDLPFSERTAQKLMAIARHPVLSNPTHESVLPPHVETLYLLSQLPPDQLEQMLDDGTITAETERKEVEEIAEEIKRNGVYWYSEVFEAFEKLNECRIKTEHHPEELTKLIQFAYEARIRGDQIWKLLPDFAQWLTKLDGKLKKKLDSPEGREELAAMERFREGAREERERARRNRPISWREQNRRERARAQCEEFNSIGFRSKAERKRAVAE
jgi:hypothetical protein